jgi:hypothetical protein
MMHRNGQQLIVLPAAVRPGCCCSFKHGFWVERPDGSGGVVRLPAMLKVKDWPPRSAFTQEMQRHFVVRHAALLVSAAP